MRQVLSDIERSLSDNQSAATRPPRTRLEALAVSFEAGHPTLSASLREFIELLGNAGL